MSGPYDYFQPNYNDKKKSKIILTIAYFSNFFLRLFPVFPNYSENYNEYQKKPITLM